MIGAIIGDVVGSKFEFNNLRNTEFELFDRNNCFTDDTVCTVAFMDWMTNCTDKNEKTATEYLHKWCRKYLNAGYGGRFWQWVCSLDPKPYGSFGNGAGMRISPIGYGATEFDELKELTEIATSITHNHKEGIKGALAIATCIRMALNNSSKDEIKKYAIEMYPEIKNLDYENLKATFTFNETCQGTVPQSIYCFLISNSFEDCLRKTISIGGDCDTTSAMSCAIAEAFYGIPEQFIEKVKTYLTSEMIAVIDSFYKKFKKPNKEE